MSDRCLALPCLFSCIVHTCTSQVVNRFYLLVLVLEYVTRRTSTTGLSDMTLTQMTSRKTSTSDISSNEVWSLLSRSSINGVIDEKT